MVCGSLDLSFMVDPLRMHSWYEQLYYHVLFTRCSSMVRVFAHGVMGHWIYPSLRTHSRYEQLYEIIMSYFHY